MSNNSIFLKREILQRIVKSFLSDDFEKNTRLIPFDMRPKGAEVPYRCCIYKERAILKDRVIAGLGFAIEDDDETVSLTEYAHRALLREKPEENLLTVLGAACKGCVPKRIYVTDLCQGCVARTCTSACRAGAIEIVNGKANIDSSKCKACKMCIDACPYNAIVKVAVPCEDHCPVNAIEKNQDGTAKIDFDKCISCGKCVTHCPFGAVHEKSQLIEVLKLLKAKKEISVMFAPAIAGEFEGTIGQLKSALKKVGFTNVYEVARGADITIKTEAQEFRERMMNAEPFMTTSCCAGYNELVNKHIQELDKYRSNAKTPLFYTSEIVKFEHPDGVNIFISPCVAKKHEAKFNNNIDLVINSEELNALFMGLNINVKDCEEYIDDKEPSRQGRKFPVSGGVAEAVEFALGFSICSKIVSGVDKNSIKNLKQYAKEGKCEDANLVEVMCCEGGCIRGNATMSDTRTSFKRINSLASKGSDIEIISD
ncbi:monomeric [bacterium]|nr:monomeric [FeFe] hydrogenase [bacterium]